jgi:hypothetical protein
MAQASEVLGLVPVSVPGPRWGGMVARGRPSESWSRPRARPSTTEDQAQKDCGLKDRGPTGEAEATIMRCDGDSPATPKGREDRRRSAARLRRDRSCWLSLAVQDLRWFAWDRWPPGPRPRRRTSWSPDGNIAFYPNATETRRSLRHGRRWVARAAAHARAAEESVVVARWRPSRSRPMRRTATSTST